MDDNHTADKRYLFVAIFGGELCRNFGKDGAMRWRCVRSLDQHGRWRPIGGSIPEQYGHVPVVRVDLGDRKAEKEKYMLLVRSFID